MLVVAAGPGAGGGAGGGGAPRGHPGRLHPRRAPGDQPPPPGPAQTGRLPPARPLLQLGRVGHWGPEQGLR